MNYLQNNQILQFFSIVRESGGSVLSEILVIIVKKYKSQNSLSERFIPRLGNFNIRP